MSKIIDELEICPFRPQYFEDVRDIYQLGIDTKLATFETVAPDYEHFNQKFLPTPRLVAIKNNRPVGWVALSRVSVRPVYSGVCEVSLYVHPNHQKEGIGRKLLEQVIEESEKQNIWTLQAGIFTDNIGSIKLHKSCGFREVGFREKIGKRDGVWRDNIFLERRSRKAGIS